MFCTIRQIHSNVTLQPTIVLFFSFILFIDIYIYSISYIVTSAQHFINIYFYPAFILHQVQHLQLWNELL